jgi:hypothetical protein
VIPIVLSLALTAGAGAAPAPQTRICEAIAASDHLNVARTCPPLVQPQSFTVTASAPAQFKATVAYTIIDTPQHARAAWLDAAIDGAETVLPAVGPVPGLSDPSHIYFAAGQGEAEAAALVGTVIVDVVVVPAASGSVNASLKTEIAALLRSAAGRVQAAEARALG